MFTDTHAHIYSEEFSTDLEEMLLRARNMGVTDIYMPNIDSTSVDEMLRIAATYDGCHPMMGLHPCYVKENFKQELSVVERHLDNTRFAAIGEIGIDLYWDTTFAKEQEIAFRHQIALAKSYNLPVIIHSRESLDLTISIVKEMQDGTLKGIYHCFNGTIAQAQQIMDMGFFMGIGGVITYKNAGVDKVVQEIPLDFLVLETDAPYLSPVPYRGKRNESSYIKVIAEKLAEINGVSISTIASATTINANKIFAYTNN